MILNILNKKFQKEPLMAFFNSYGLLIKTCLVSIPFFILYEDVFRKLIKQWRNDDDFSYCFIIPFLSLYLIWKKRYLLKKIHISSSYSGLFLILFAFLLLVVGHYGVSDTLARLSILLMLIGLVLYNFGKEFLRITLFAILFLFFMIPIPSIFLSPLTLGLQLLSTKFAVFLLRSFNIPVCCSGNIIDLGIIQLQFIEACSGLRYLLPLMALCWFYLANYQLNFSKTIIFLSSTFFIAIFLNALRLFITALLSIYFDPKLATGFFHNFTGLIIFIIGIFYIFIFDRLTNSKPRLLSNANDKVELKDIHIKLFDTSMVVSLVVLFCFCLTVRGIEASAKPNAIANLPKLPERIDNWIGHNVPISKEILLRTGASHSSKVIYSSPENGSVIVYIAYYAPLNQDHIGHTPNICLPGAGWTILDLKKIQIDSFLNNKKYTIKVNQLVVDKEGHKMLIYYWFLNKGRVFTDKYLLKLYQVYSALKFTPSACYQIVLYADLSPDETIVDGENKLKLFVDFILEMFSVKNSIKKKSIMNNYISLLS